MDKLSQGLPKDLSELSRNKRLLEIQEQLLIQSSLSSNDPESILKAQQYLQLQVPRYQEKSGVRSFFVDPFLFNESLGFREATAPVSYNVLRKMGRTPVMKAILKTRIEQIADFCTPQPDKYSTGFVIRKKRRGSQDETKNPTTEELRMIEEITEFILNCGNQSDPWAFHQRDLDTFMRAYIPDCLVLDQGTFEVVHDRKGNPIRWVETDGATFRLASTRDVPRESYKKGYPPAFVQIYDSRIVNEYYPWELSFGIRNPSSDIRTNGYGRSELEDLINTITALLYSDEYNRRFFSQGSIPKGILKVKGNLPDHKLTDFRSQWQSQMAGVINAHKTPVINADEVDWVDLHKSNKDMEFDKYQQFLIRVACANYTISPEEIGMSPDSSNKLGSPSSKDEIEYSKSKGLKPILKFIQARFQKHLLNPHEKYKDYEMVFVGLEADSAEKELDMDIKSFQGGLESLEEVRARRGAKKPNMDDTWGNPVIVQQKQMASMDMGGGAPGGSPFAPGGENLFEFDAGGEEGGGEEENPMIKSLQEFLTDISKSERSSKIVVRSTKTT